MAASTPSIEKLQKKVEKEPTPVVFLQLAEEYRKEGLYQDAINTCREGLKRHPNYWSTRVSMGRIYREMGETEKAREEALRKQHEASLQRAEYENKVAQMERETAQAAALRDARLKLQPNDPVRVERFDKPGRVVRIDAKKNLAVVSLGLGQWEVPLDEVFPLDS